MTDAEYEAGDVNTADETPASAGSGGSGLPRNVLEYVAKAIVDEPDAVTIETSDTRRGIELSLHVSPDDMGKVIGKRGRVAQAIRSVVRAAGAADGVEVSVDIVD
jgi:uncharacterized protein